MLLLAVVNLWCSFSTALNASLVGLGLVYGISLTDIFQYCVKVSAEVENVVSYHL